MDIIEDYTNIEYLKKWFNWVKCILLYPINETTASNLFNILAWLRMFLKICLEMKLIKAFF